VTLIPYSELPLRRDDNPLFAAADELRGLICRAYNAAPWAFIPPAATAPDFVRDVNRGFYDDFLCAEPLPPEPQDNGLTFADGCREFYRVTLDYTETPGNIQRSTFIDAFSVVNAYTSIDDGVYFLNITNTINGTTANLISVITNGDRITNNITITKLSGDPIGTCDDFQRPDPVIIFPPIVIVPTPNQTYEVPIEVTTFEFEGDTYIQPSFFTPISPIFFNFDGVNLNPTFAPDINFNPEFGGNGDNGDNPPSLPDIENVVNQGNQTVINQLTQTIENNQCDLTPVLNRIDGLSFQFDAAEILDIIRCYTEDELGDLEFSIATNADDGGIFPIPDNAVVAVIELVGLPTPQTRIQSGSGDAPNVVYWGWYAVDFLGEGPIQRQELHYSTQAVSLSDRNESIIINPIRGNQFRLGFVVSTKAECPTPEMLTIPITQSP
jgi:hypothetical protein